jgi:YegS/Rv2252/BmrU family lipid kinase
MKHLFIINPFAGKGRTLKYIDEIKNAFREMKEEYFIEITKYPSHASLIAEEYSSKGDFRIYSVGGDGTLNEVLNGMADSNSSLAIIPAGSGNDFIRSIYKRNHMRDILKSTINGTEKLIDIGMVNGRYFINISSVGIDAFIVVNSLRMKKLPFIPGKMAYILGIINALIRYSGSETEINFDGEIMKLKFLLLAVANGKYYGGGMLVTPQAQVDDGMFDICLVKDMSRLKILRVFPKLIKGVHGSLKEVSFRRCNKVIINSKDTIPMNVDGEIEHVNQIVFEIIPKKIKIVVPN